MKEQLEKLKKTTGSSPIFFVCGTRNSKINDLYLHELQRHINYLKKNGTTDVNLIINSIGGDGHLIPKIVENLNEFENYYNTVIRIASSAATMLAFGSKKTYMCKNSHLGPIDPSTTLATVNGSRYVNCVEIVNRSQKFLQDNPSVSPMIIQSQFFPDQISVAQNVINRTKNDFIKIGRLNKQGKSDEVVSELAEKLIYGYHTHSDRIFFKEAKSIGFEVEKLEEATEEIILGLYSKIVGKFKLSDPWPPNLGKCPLESFCIVSEFGVSTYTEEYLITPTPQGNVQELKKVEWIKTDL